VLVKMSATPSLALTRVAATAAPRR